jgi:diguanylate cyclase (GGDEF)-like protein
MVNGEKRPLMLNLISLVSPASARYLGRLETENVTDALTGLYNRGYFDQQMAVEAGRVARYNSFLGMVLGDVDHFKRVNDVYGHRLGDLVLQYVAGVMTSKSRQNAGDSICRYGGEEIAVILPHTDIEGARTYAEKQREAVQCFSLTGALENDRDAARDRGRGREIRRYEAALDSVRREGDIRLTMSFGAGSFDRERLDIEGPESLVSLTDMALYTAKKTGRNRVVTLDDL